MPNLLKLMNYAKVVSETVKLNFWDLISMTSPLPWKQLALILLFGGGVITPSLRFLLHRIRKLCQDFLFCNIRKYSPTSIIQIVLGRRTFSCVCITQIVWIIKTR